MKLFCSTKIQQILGCKYEKSPIPPDPLDSWYANAISLNGRDTVVAILPELRFCVILWNIQKGQWGNLDTMLVQAIRSTLLDPLSRIPRAIVDLYLPEGTVPEHCATGDRGFVAKMGAVTTQILENEYDWYDQSFDPQSTQFEVNSRFIYLEDGRPVPRYDALRILLLKRYGEAVPAMELEISLDLPQDSVRRVLIVPGDTYFDMLHRYLQLAFGWKGHHSYRFVLPVSQARPLPGRVPGVCEEETSPGSSGEIGRDSFALLADCLQVGDTFRYLYGDDDPWEHVIQFVRYVPYPTAEPPICTLCEGTAPPEGEGGITGYQAFCKIASNPQDPQYREVMDLVEENRSTMDGAEAVNSMFRMLLRH